MEGEQKAKPRTKQGGTTAKRFLVEEEETLKANEMENPEIPQRHKCSWDDGEWPGVKMGLTLVAVHIPEERCPSSNILSTTKGNDCQQHLQLLSRTTEDRNLQELLALRLTHHPLGMEDTEIYLWRSQYHSFLSEVSLRNWMELINQTSPCLGGQCSESLRAVHSR